MVGRICDNSTKAWANKARASATDATESIVKQWNVTERQRTRSCDIYCKHHTGSDSTVKLERAKVLNKTSHPRIFLKHRPSLCCLFQDYSEEFVLMFFEVLTCRSILLECWLYNSILIHGQYTYPRTDLSTLWFSRARKPKKCRKWRTNAWTP